MTFPGERGLSLGYQNEFLPTANQLAERIASLDEKILYGGPQGRRKAERKRDDLFDQWAAYYPNHLIATPPVDAISPLNDHAEPVTARRARKPAISPVYQFGLATMLVGTAAGAMFVPEVRADEQPPLPQKMTGQIDSQTQIEFFRQKEEGLYATRSLRLQKAGPDPASLAWERFAATGGDIVNGWANALDQFKAKITGTLAQCADMIVWTNRSSFSDFEKQSSARRMNTNASPVMASIQPTVMVNGNMERNYCGVKNSDLLRIQPTKIPSPIKPTQASTDPMGENEKRNNTLFGLAFVTSALGLVSGALLWIRRRNQMGIGQTSLVPVKPIEYTAALKPSYHALDTKRLDTPEEETVGSVVGAKHVQSIRNLADDGAKLPESVIDEYIAVRTELRRHPELMQQQTTPPKSQKR